MKEKIGFLIFHILFAACQIAMPILGYTVISFVFYIVGGAVIAFGFLSFLPGVKFWIEETKDGYKYEANNVRACLLTMLITIVIGAAIAAIPQYLQESGVFVPIFVYLVSIFVGLKIMAENSTFSYMSVITRWIGKLVPCLYIMVVFIMIIPLLNPFVVIDPVISMILRSVAGLIHLVRTVMVMVHGPF